MTTLHTVSFQKTVLATLIGLCLSQSAFALQELSDDGLSETTGEGIALLPQDTYMIFRGAGANEATPLAGTDGIAGNPDDRLNDTGYIRYIPVGPLTSEASTAGAGKADLFLYGLAVSKSDNNTNTRIASTAANASIKSWGTASNPWLLKASTAYNVPDFYVSGTNGGTSKSSVTYLSVEAPLYNENIAALTSDTGLDAYKLKLGLWADAFVRDPSKIEGDANQFCLNGCTRDTSSVDTTQIPRENRLRLQAIWNNFSVNGSNLQLFQTLGGVGLSGDTGINNGMSKFYNNTLGASGILRFNSGDAANVKATYNAGVSSRTYNTDRNATAGSADWSSTEVWNTYANTSILGGDNGSAGGCNAGGVQFGSVACQFRYRDRAVKDSVSGASWIAPDPNGSNVLRLSTRETTNTGLLSTPALGGGNAPTFDDDDGIFIYNPNINLVLGSLYQPVVFGSDGKNFSLEIARIPNKQEIYTKIYTRYAGDTGDAGVTYYGSTCNVYQCGSSTVAGYQGGSALNDYSSTALAGKKLATHSSISFGTVKSNDGGQTLVADSSVEALGIFFGTPQNRTNISGTQIFKEAQYQQRQQRVDTSYIVTDRYRLTVSNGAGGFGGGGTATRADPYGQASISCNYTGISGCSSSTDRWYNTSGNHVDWVYLTNVDASGNKIFGNDDGTYTRYCTNTTTDCLTWYNGAALGTGGTGNGYPATVTNVNQIVGNSMANPGSGQRGADDCWPGESGGACNGSSGSTTTDGLYGLSRLSAVNNGGSSNTPTPTHVNNTNWTYGTRANAPWFRVAGGQAAVAYGSGLGSSTAISSDIVPTAVTGGVNPSALNNFGSAVIDGLLIQHLKITTKGL
jgi:hypothetical protein